MLENIKRHACHAKRGYATSETSKSDRCCKTRHRHGHSDLTRTVANGCGRKRNVERTHPQPPDPQSETGTLATHSGRYFLGTSPKFPNSCWKVARELLGAPIPKWSAQVHKIYGFVPPLPSSLNVCPGMAPHLFVPHDDFRYGLPPDPVIFTKQLLRNRQNSTIARLRLQWLLPCWSHKWDYARLSAGSFFWMCLPLLFQDVRGNVVRALTAILGEGILVSAGLRTGMTRIVFSFQTWLDLDAIRSRPMVCVPTYTAGRSSYQEQSSPWFASLECPGVNPFAQGQELVLASPCVR